MKKPLKQKLLFIGPGRVCTSIIPKIKDLSTIGEIYLKGRKDLHKKDFPFCKIFKDEFTKINMIIISLSGQTPEARKKNFMIYQTNQKIREAELDINVKEIRKILNFLRMFNNEVPIIVITNPVDVITNLLGTKLNRENVIGFGLSLDCGRYEKFLNKKKLHCIGMHGDAIPVLGESKNFYEKLSAKVDKNLLEFVRKKEIPFNFIAKQFQQFILRYTGTKESIVHLCAYVSKYNSIKNFSISIPFYVRNMKIIKPLTLRLNKYEKSFLSQKIKSIRKLMRKYE